MSKQSHAENKNSKDKNNGSRFDFIYNPQFWSILSIFVLITLHHYDNLTSFRLFSTPDLPLGITRHTIDRILYLVPIILSSVAFGSRGGKITLALAFIVMLPRSIFISPSPVTAMWETLLVVLIGSLIPIGLEHYRSQEQQLEATIEQLESTQKELHTTVQLSIEQQQQLAVINTLTRMLSQSFELDRVLQTAADMVIEVAGAEVVLVFSIDYDEQELKLLTYEGISHSSASALSGMKLGEGAYGRVAQTGRPVATSDVSQEPRFRFEPLKSENLKSELSVPLTARGKTVGVLCVISRIPKQFKNPEIALLSALGDLIGIAIANSTLARERELASDRLKVSEKRYRQLFENAHDAIWIQDFENRITAANQAAANLFACSLSELIGSNIMQFMSEKDSAFADSDRIETGNDASEIEPYKRKIVRKDGSEAFVMLTSNIVSTGRKADGIQFIGMDITKEVRMQENQAYYLQRITNAHEEERQRISRDLHDSTAQNIIAALRQLENFNEQNTQLSSDKLEFLWKLHGYLKDILHEIRQLSRDLRPSVLDNLGLMPAVEWLVEQLDSENGINATLKVVGKEKRFSPEIEVALFRIIKEALRNITKHARASHVEISINFENAGTRVVIVDDGEGFELPASIGEFSRHGKLGIDGIQTRARLAGGSFKIESQPGNGTVITVVLPV
ncbi:MAG: GAF domain-containing protein [Rubrobacteridae bacterium]|nr:GAF domain-containing protein [Rubrobacteridae bacterium]